jgi:hypothetical protein
MMFSSDEADAGEGAIFSICRTAAEVLVVVHHLDGLQAVENLLAELLLVSTREGMRQDADELKMAGLVELASLVRRFARKAKPGPRKFGVGYQTRSALICIERRRAETSH